MPKNQPAGDDDPLSSLSPEEQAEIDVASVITPEDVEDAMRQWRQDASHGMRDLLDATPGDADDTGPDRRRG